MPGYDLCQFLSTIFLRTVDSELEKPESVPFLEVPNFMLGSSAELFDDCSFLLINSRESPPVRFRKSTLVLGCPGLLEHGQNFRDQAVEAVGIGWQKVSFAHMLGDDAMPYRQQNVDDPISGNARVDDSRVDDLADPAPRPAYHQVNVLLDCL